ncbi:EFR1 family ferrodoxin [Orenia marismortui]|uniref:EFR1 family ferrodoxin n=1 Tax=Orenia marismortui TaxID=46469 RepID=UPI00037C08AE|nr:EFR1 family ferrodoxin [Orenia marismortui]
MQIDKLSKVYFSPTNTTQEIVEAIAKGLRIEDTERIDLTKVDTRKNFSLNLNSNNQLLIIGVPVYEERIPDLVKEPLNNLRGEGQGVILIAVYGNIGEGIALQELKNLVEKNGFNVVAAGSFIGEHSFSNSQLKIATGRPDEDDLKQAEQFAIRITEKLLKIDNIEEISKLNIQGELPLMAKFLPKNSAKIFAKRPKVAKEKCNNCGICIKVCPVGAIDQEELKINNEICLRCFACAKKCPQEARNIKFKKELLVKFILRKKGAERKEVKIYL